MPKVARYKYIIIIIIKNKTYRGARVFKFNSTLDLSMEKEKIRSNKEIEERRELKNSHQDNQSQGKAEPSSKSKCEYCGCTFKQIGKHAWRCKEKKETSFY